MAMATASTQCAFLHVDREGARAPRKPPTNEGKEKKETNLILLLFKCPRTSRENLVRHLELQFTLREQTSNDASIERKHRSRAVIHWKKARAES